MPRSLMPREKFDQIVALLKVELVEGAETSAICKRVAQATGVSLSVVHAIRRGRYGYQSPYPRKYDPYLQLPPDIRILRRRKPLGPRGRSPYPNWNPTEEEIERATAAIRETWHEEDPRLKQEQWTPPVFAESFAN